MMENEQTPNADAGRLDQLVSRLAVAGAEYATISAGVAQECCRGERARPDYAGLQAKREEFAAALSAIYKHAQHAANDLAAERGHTDRLLFLIGYSPDRTRDEAGRLKVNEMADALRDMMRPGAGG